MWQLGQHDHPIEWVWFAFTIIDSWTSLSSWLSSRRDWKRAEKARAMLHGEERIVKASSFAVTYAIKVTSYGNFIFALILFSCAVLSLLLPPPPPDYLAVKQSLVLIAFLIGATMLNTFLSTYGRLIRYRLQTGYYEREERHRQEAGRSGKTAGGEVAQAYKTDHPVVVAVAASTPDPTAAKVLAEKTVEAAENTLDEICKAETDDAPQSADGQVMVRQAERPGDESKDGPAGKPAA